MTKTEVLATAFEMAREGRGFSPPAALEFIAELIRRKDVESDFRDGNVDQLLRLGACILALRHSIFMPTAKSLSLAAQAEHVDAPRAEQG
jgi:hypothetical protein